MYANRKCRKELSLQHRRLSKSKTKCALLHGTNYTVFDGDNLNGLTCVQCVGNVRAVCVHAARRMWVVYV